VFNNFQQYYSYIMAVGFIGEGPRTSRRKSLTNIKREGEVNKVVLTLETTKKTTLIFPLLCGFMVIETDMRIVI
jgi:hypothetical protein